MKLYQIPLSPNCQKVVAIAHDVGVPLALRRVDVFKGDRARGVLRAWAGANARS